MDCLKPDDLQTLKAAVTLHPKAQTLNFYCTASSEVVRIHRRLSRLLKRVKHVKQAHSWVATAARLQRLLRRRHQNLEPSLNFIKAKIVQSSIELIH